MPQKFAVFVFADLKVLTLVKKKEFSRFQASAAAWLRPLLFGDVTFYP